MNEEFGLILHNEAYVWIGNESGVNNCNICSIGKNGPCFGGKRLCTHLGIPIGGFFY